MSFRIKRIISIVLCIVMLFVMMSSLTGCGNNLKNKLTAHKWTCEMQEEVGGYNAHINTIILSYEFNEDGKYKLTFDYSKSQDHDTDKEELTGYWRIDDDKKLNIRREGSNVDSWISYEFYEMSEDQIKQGATLSSKRWYVSDNYFLFTTPDGGHFGAYTPN